MKKLFLLALCLLFYGNSAFSQTVYDDNYKENPNYVQGNKYLQNSQYTSAINEFKKAIRTNPADKSALIGLSNAYNMRAQYYNNTVKATDNAINDIKSALFYLKYFYSDTNDTSLNQSIAAMEKNLNILEGVSDKTSSLSAKLSNAKTLRVKGEFAASAYDYFQLANEQAYKLDANTALGDIFTILNRPEKALQFYKTAISAAPDNSDLHLKLARTYEQINDFNSALKEYSSTLDASSEREDILSSLEHIWQKKVDENPKDAENHANLGVVFQKQKRYAEALQEYRKAEALNPSNINTKVNIGTLYQEQNKFDSAISVYDSILTSQPNNVSVLIYKAECLAALRKNEDAVNTYKTALNLDPKNAAVKAKLFELLKNTMPVDELLAYLYKNVQNSPMDANTYYEFAYELHKADKLDDAITYYIETIKLDNSKTDAYINLSQAYRQKKNYAQAYEIIKKAMSIAPQNELVKKQYDIIANEYTANSYNIAAEEFRSGNYNNAIEEYKKVTPPTVDSYMGIAASYQALKNNSEAVNYYKKAMELNPKNSDIPFYIASIYANSNDLTNAKQYVDIALAQNPSNKQAKELNQYIKDKDIEIKLNQAISFYDGKKYNEAIALLNSIISGSNSNATAFYYRALSYDAVNNYQKAIDDYNSAIKYAPEMTIVYYSLGVDYDALQNYKSAKEAYKKYIDKTMEDNDYKQYAISRVEEIK